MELIIEGLQTVAIVLLALWINNNHSKVTAQHIELQGSVANLIKKISDKL